MIPPRSFVGNTPQPIRDIDSAIVARLQLLFPSEGVSAVGTLLVDEAPRTCEAILAALPIEGDLVHGIWSGPEVYLPIAPTIRVTAENQVVGLVPGDIGYYYLAGRTLEGWPNDFAEVLFGYDRGARPTMPSGPVAVNLFGRVTDNLEAFARTCARAQREGVKRFRITALD